MNEQILKIMKQKRKEIAGKEGKEFSKIFPNAVLEAISKTRPKTKEELTEIKGWSKEISIEEKIFSVQELLLFINKIFSVVKTLKVRGEITEVNQHPNGYCFFTLKDSQTEEHSVNCYISRWKFESINYLIKIGMEVIVHARPSLYKNGRFSLIIEAVEPYGEGALKKAFEALKKKLEAKGYFDPARKRPIPEFIQKIGLITSESGAAIRDFRKNLGEYGFEIYFIDVRVEGDYAEQSIVSAFKWFNQNLPELDVIVLIRGGGSLEELKAFNSEKVAEAIILSRLPVLTGIGHERDKTIADYCADRSFSTPSLVATFIKTQREQLIEKVNLLSEDLISLEEKILSDNKNYLLEKRKELEFIFFNIIEKHKLLFSRIAEQMSNGFNEIFKKFKNLEKQFSALIYNYHTLIRNQFHKLDILTHQSLNFLRRNLDKEKGRLKTAARVLFSLNPEAILKRGYSIVYKSDYHILKEAKDVKLGENIFVKLYKGKLSSRVEKIEK